MQIPRTREFDLSLAFLREGYDLIGNRCAALGSDIFESRLMLQRVVCLRGAAAAELFYGSDKFTRQRAMPLSVLLLLQDFGSVQLLDGDRHRHRKAMFNAIGSAAAAQDLAAVFESEWHAAIPRFVDKKRIVLFDELELMLTRSGAAWAGAPLSEQEAHTRATEYSAMLEAAGSIGPRVLRALWLRQRTERWAHSVIRAARSGAMRPAADTVLARIADHRDLDGRALDEKTAAVELINVLRPIVAVARFIVFAAKALHDHPAHAARLRTGDEAFLDRFVQEVRRRAPFFPAIGGRLCAPATWRGHSLDEGTWVLLDLFGTNQDARSWDNPRAFDPDRFLQTPPGLFNLVPQGGGDAARTHRCPGEKLALALMKVAVRQLTRAIDYTVPPQDLRVSRRQIPALPASRFVMTDIVAKSSS